MRPIRILLLLVNTLVANDAPAQYSAPAAPGSWGGYALPESVPYQPTMMGNPAAGQPIVTYPWASESEASMDGAVMHYGQEYGPGSPMVLPPAAMPGAVYGPWQPYPPPGQDMSLQDPLYSQTREPSLRESLTPPDARNGFFQKARFSATWIPAPNDNSLGWTDLRTEVVTALPFFTRENPIIITPSYELHFVDSPSGIDLPPRLHDLALDLHVFRVYANRWIFDFAVTPGLYADDHSFDSNEALRINGRALAVYAPNLDIKWILGVTYVDGGWNRVVPVAGVVYEPNDDVKYEIVFPRPRIAWRLPSSPAPGKDEYWLYLMAEFSNLAWAIEQNNVPDVLYSRDFRVLLGVERKIYGSLSTRAEIGYVFNRDIRIKSVSSNDISQDSSFLIRAGVAY